MAVVAAMTNHRIIRTTTNIEGNAKLVTDHLAIVFCPWPVFQYPLVADDHILTTKLVYRFEQRPKRILSP
jgi:hypothetical protein